MEGYVYVDNGLQESIKVEVDGIEVATVRPGTSKKLTLALGPREFRVTSGDQVVYEATHTIDLGDRPFRRPKYILNPDNSNRYCNVEVVYGDDSLTQGSADMMVSLISKAASHNAEGIDDEATRRQWELDRQIQCKYRSLAGDMCAFGDEAFFQIETSGNILQPLPNMVFTSSHSSSAKRHSLIRVPQQIHDFIYQAKQVEEPTQEDLAKMAVAHEVVQSLVPFN